MLETQKDLELNQCENDDNNKTAAFSFKYTRSGWLPECENCV